MFKDRSRCYMFKGRSRCYMFKDRSRCYMFKDRSRCYMFKDRSRCMITPCMLTWLKSGKQQRGTYMYMIAWYHSVSNLLHTLWNIKNCTMPATQNPVLSFSDFVISFRHFVSSFLFVVSSNTESRLIVIYVRAARHIGSVFGYLRSYICLYVLCRDMSVFMYNLKINTHTHIPYCTDISAAVCSPGFHCSLCVDPGFS